MNDVKIEGTGRIEAGEYGSVKVAGLSASTARAPSALPVGQRSRRSPVSIRCTRPEREVREKALA